MKNKISIFLLLLSFFLLGSSRPYYAEYQLLPPVDPGPLFIIPEPRIPLPPRREVPREYRELFQRVSTENGLPLGVLESIAFVESGFTASAMSPVRKSGHCDRGMFQFNSFYHGWYEDQYNGGAAFDPMDPVEAIRIAALHVQFLYERYGNWPDVFMAYNAGIGAVDKWEIPDSTWDYLLKIYSDQEGK